MNNIDVREKYYKFKSVTLVKRDFIEYRSGFKVVNILFWISTIPTLDEILIKTQYYFIKDINNNKLQCGFEIAPKTNHNYYFLETKYKIRKELEKCEQ